MTEQLLIAILYSRDFIQNIKIAGPALGVMRCHLQSRPRGDEVSSAVPPSGWWWCLLRHLLPHFRFSLFWCCLRSFSMFWNFLHRFKNKKNLNNCFLKDITKLYFATKIFSLPDDKCLRNCIVANWLLF